MATNALLATLAAAGLAFAPGDKPPVPDLTKGGQPDKGHDWTLGPTGARGWVWGWQGHTTNARQILVTAVAPGSPADGVLARGDVLLGVDGKLFDDDARIQFARAVTAAETEAGQGRLRLIRWREGRTENVEVKLAVLGTYSDTAPYDCPKSRRVLELGCRAIAKQGWKDRRGNIQVSIANDLAALALLASGDESYRPLTAEYARKVAEHQPGGHISWGYAYDTLFLAEYALATKDESVMAGLRRLALDIARGQSRVGTWGHSFARPDGILNGYGCMNQPGIVLTLAMALAREAGIRDPVLEQAIAKSARFLRWYVHKGAIPYGDHDPWPWHEDNGKCSSAAVLFDLLGDQEAATFFSRMATAAHAERESGHTGNFFNVTWALPGVSRAGPAAVAAYFREQAWYYDLARGWDGRCLYQGIPGEERDSYSGWDCTGAYLLGYALPFRKIVLTGRKPPVVPALTAREAAETVAAGRDFSYWSTETLYDRRDTETLLAGLASWSPAVRKRSAKALGRRDGDFVPRLLQMIDGTDRDARYGAVEALGCLGPRADAAADRLRALLEDRDPWIRHQASEALARLSPAARTAATSDLLRAADRQDPQDPRGRVQGTVAEALFSPGPGKRGPRSILADSLEGVDRPLLYAAIRTLLRNEDGRIRGRVASTYRLLSPKDVAALLPDIMEAIRHPAPSGEMFADEIRLAGLDLLSRLKIREGLTMCVDLMEPERWGQGHRIPRCLEYLARYAGHARSEIPRLREVRAALVKRDPRKGEGNPLVTAIDKCIAAIEADRNPPALRSMEEFQRAP
ncbi:MAG: DUF6288 domain-containing protein [Planctomycetota bacterium]